MRPRRRPRLTLLALALLLTATAGGETLHYRIRTGFVTAGSASLSVSEHRQPGVIQFRLSARSSGLLDTLYPIRDRITSLARASDLATMGLQRRIREGRRRLNDRWTIDPDRGEARERSGRRVTLAPGSLDILSVLWRLRRGTPAPGDTLRHPIFLGPGPATMTAVVGPRTRAEVPAGVFECLPIYPSLGPAPRVHADADVVLEFSDDPGRLPVRIRVRLPMVGHATAELIGVTP